MKSSYSMLGRTELIVFWKQNWHFFFYKNNKVSNMPHTLKNENWESIQQNTVKNTFGHLEKFLRKINWGFLLKSNAWPTLCYWSSSTLCKGPFCAPIRKFLFFTILHPFLYQDLCKLIVNMWNFWNSVLL